MSLKQKTIQGIKWSAIAQFGKQGSQFVIVAILARILSPDDFGLLGMALVFIQFAMILGELGVSRALIQKNDLTDEHLSTAFWLNIIVGILLTIIFIAIAPLIACFYDKPLLTYVVRVLSVNFILASFTVIQQVILQKEMNFKPLMIRDIGAVITSGIIGIVCAFKGLGVWSLVFQFLSFTLFNGILLWTFSSWRPKLMFSLSHFKAIFVFSIHMIGFQIVHFFSRNIDYLLIGKFLGSEALGFYTLAYKLMLVPLQNISWVISRVIFPAFSKIQTDLIKVRMVYIRMTRLVSLLTLPLMAFIFTGTPEAVALFFGEQWIGAVPVIQTLCFAGMIQSVISSLGEVRLSQGRSGLHLCIGLLNSVLVAIVVAASLPWGVNIVALSYTMYFWFWGYLEVSLTTRSLPFIRRSDFFLALVPACIISLFMILIPIGLRFLLKPLSDFNLLVILLLLSGVIYILLVIVMKQIEITGNSLREKRIALRF
jgi:PST family polysaccharide transporter